MSINVTVLNNDYIVNVVNDEEIIVTLSQSGDAGPIGYTGSVGPIGYTGSQGVGYTGSMGLMGYTGSQGIEGQRGYAGSQGNQGYTGSIGTIGYSGSVGSIGYSGSRGFTGSAGSNGYTGSLGYTGSFGNIGYTGSAGTNGFTGSQGYTGSVGFSGSMGQIGYTGSQGLLGYTGSQGTDALWNFTGAYSGGAAYAVGDLATYDGSTWYRIDSNGGNVGDTPVEGPFWTLISEKGDIGYTGSQGNVGYTGSAGSLGSVTTDDITEGVTNLYFTEARVDTAIADSVTTAALTITGQEGPIVWNATEGTLDVPLDNGVTLQLGQEQHVYAKATEAISNGMAVMFAGAQGNHLLIAKADINAVGFRDEYVVGVATQDFTTNQFGYVTSFGKVNQLNTNAFNEGDLLYISTTPGVLTATPPTAPTHAVLVAAVTRKHATQGSIFVRPKMGEHVGELHDVLITDVANDDVLVYNSTLGVWENSPVLGDIDAALTAILGV